MILNSLLFGNIHIENSRINLGRLPKCTWPVGKTGTKFCPFDLLSCVSWDATLHCHRSSRSTEPAFPYAAWLHACLRPNCKSISHDEVVLMTLLLLSDYCPLFYSRVYFFLRRVSQCLPEQGPAAGSHLSLCQLPRGAHCGHPEVRLRSWGVGGQWAAQLGSYSPDIRVFLTCGLSLDMPGVLLQGSLAVFVRKCLPLENILFCFW